MKQLWEDPLRRFIKYQEDVSEYVEFLEEALGFLFEEKARSEIKPVEDFFKRVIDHFEFEEKTIFPSILSGHARPESIELILELQKEHGSMLKGLEEFRWLISVSMDKDLRNARLNHLVREIIDSLLLHASKEDDKLLPILQENRQIFDREDAI